MGDDAEMLSIVSSANIACGGHASDPETMYRTLILARESVLSDKCEPVSVLQQPQSVRLRRDRATRPERRRGSA